MSKIKIGVFGAHRGMTMIHQLIGNPYAELVAVCDKYKPVLDQCAKLADEVGIKIELYERFDDFFNCDMEAVVMANYAHEHAKFAIGLLESGRHIMSEVLTCANLAEAVQLAETVEKTGKIYSYAENYCYFNTTYEMRKLYHRGDIGELMHAEGEYIHDCSSIWPQITYGEKGHWRNQLYSTFYCTHSLGPVLFATGLRPVRVFGVETRNMPFMRKLGSNAAACGMEIVILENQAMVKSIHGGLKREPSSINYQLYGSRGSMETDRWEGGQLHVYREGERNCVGQHSKYCPEFTIKDAAGAGHGGGDFFTTHYFIRNILGDEDAKANCIDVYHAIDMCIPGILAYKSIVNGNTPQEIPNVRNKNERDAYRNDTFCTFRESAGDMWVPNNINIEDDISDDIYAMVAKKWNNNEPG
ncbi:MAG: Gfo/Idh/MocA family protein [Eubacteriales bacterium]